MTILLILLGWFFAGILSAYIESKFNSDIYTVQDIFIASLMGGLRLLTVIFFVLYSVLEWFITQINKIIYSIFWDKPIFNKYKSKDYIQLSK